MRRLLIELLAPAANRTWLPTSASGRLIDPSESQRCVVLLTTQGILNNRSTVLLREEDFVCMFFYGWCLE